LIIDSKILRLD